MFGRSIVVQALQNQHYIDTTKGFPAGYHATISHLKRILPVTPSPRKKRIPRLSYTDNRNTGYFVSYRGPDGKPRKHKFGKVPRSEAVDAYEKWLAAHLQGVTPAPVKRGPRKLLEQISEPKSRGVTANILPGSLLQISSNFLTHEESRIRPEERERRPNTITQKQFNTRKHFVEDFLAFLNRQHGNGAVGRMKLADLVMEDVEAYNRLLVDSDFSDSQVRKRLQCIQGLIKRAGRPENGQQLLTWNWDSKDPCHGRRDQQIQIPTLEQMKLVLRECDDQRTAQVWLAIGCGFGQRDLSVIRVGDIDAISYDLRRPKTGLDRYGDTPRMVWVSLQRYLAKVPRPDGELIFLTERKRPLVHGNGSDSIQQWWARLRDSLGDAGKGLPGFYVLRTIGATEFGSRPGCSISAMRRWLGHSVSSAVADRYMRPVSPQTRAVVEWVRKALASGRADLSLPRQAK
jgi:integrase